MINYQLLQIFLKEKKLVVSWNFERGEYYFSVVDVIATLTDLGKIATRELSKEHKPFRLEQNKKNSTTWW